MHLSSCHATGKLTPVDISADNFDSYFPKRLLKFSYMHQQHECPKISGSQSTNVFSVRSSFAPNYFNVR